MKLRVTIDRRPDIADPEGETVRRALADLGYPEVRQVRMNRVIELDIPDANAAEAEARVEDMCRRLLANPVLEDFQIELVP